MTSNPPPAVFRYGQSVPVAAEVAYSRADDTDLGRRLAEGLDRAINATPQERAQRAVEFARRAAEYSQELANQRAAATPIPLTLETLLARMELWGWSHEYVEHLVQPYCECEDGRDGWEHCEHARDLGLVG